MHVSKQVKKINKEKTPYVGEQCGEMLGGLTAHALFEKVKSIGLMGGQWRLEGRQGQAMQEGFFAWHSHDEETVLILKFLGGPQQGKFFFFFFFWLRGAACRILVP